jgi:putative ATPase
MQLRNAPTGAMKAWGYAQGYQHAHDYPDAVAAMKCLPPELAGKVFYEPSDRGLEKKLQERMGEIRNLRDTNK